MDARILHSPVRTSKVVSLEDIVTDVIREFAVAEVATYCGESIKTGIQPDEMTEYDEFPPFTYGSSIQSMRVSYRKL